MVKRLVAACALLILVGACATATLGEGDVARVVEGAFASADVSVADIDVGDEPVDGSWPVTAEVDGDPVALEVDATEGRVTRIDFGRGEALDDASLEEIAAFQDNAAEDRARRSRTIWMLLGFFALVGLGLVVARQLRLREEAAVALGSSQP